MGRNQDITKKELVARLIAEGKMTLRQIAREAKIHEKTIFKWRVDPQFSKLLGAEVRRRIIIRKIDEAISESDFTGMSIDQLKELRDLYAE